MSSENDVNRFTGHQLEQIKKLKFSRLVCMIIGTEHVPECVFFRPNTMLS